MPGIIYLLLVVLLHSKMVIALGYLSIVKEDL